MSYDLDGHLKQDRRTGINNLIGFGQPEKINEFCKPCYYSGLSRLIPHPTEKDKLLCRNCGTSYSMEEIKEKSKPVKSLTRPQRNTMIISQKGKDKKKPKFDTPNSELSQEDLDDLRSYGYRL